MRVFATDSDQLEAWVREAEYYTGREQTYLKHFFLEQYLERAAYNIGSFDSDFVYVDGFSGPWRADDEAYEDTSFVIAMNKLRSVRNALKQRGKDFRVRCLFVEENAKRFAALQQAVADVEDMDAKALHGRFEDMIPSLVEEVGTSFALVFVDPTGWTGLQLPKIRPLLKLRCDLLVNFMFDHINRFSDEALFELCGEAPPDLSDCGPNREQRIIDFYTDRLKQAGDFKHATHTRILKPTSDRTYFYLVYGTAHPKGLLEFSKVEKKTFDEQHEVRSTAKQQHRVDATGQQELFAAPDMGADSSATEDRKSALLRAEQQLLDLLTPGERLLYDDVLYALVEKPLVWEQDVKSILKKWKVEGRLTIEGLLPPKRVPKIGEQHYLRLLAVKA